MSVDYLVIEVNNITSERKERESRQREREKELGPVNTLGLLALLLGARFLGGSRRSILCEHSNSKVTRRGRTLSRPLVASVGPVCACARACCLCVRP